MREMILVIKIQLQLGSLKDLTHMFCFQYLISQTI
jgi:hypothetical protein